jgi:hypothetical protein
MLYSLVLAAMVSTDLEALLTPRRLGAGLASRLLAGLAFIDRKRVRGVRLLPASRAKGFVPPHVH